MKKILFCLALISYGCGNNDTAGTTPLEGAQETFLDTPGLVRTEIRDAADLLLGSGYYLNGKKTASWAEYYPTGALKSVTTYVEGHKEGMAFEFETTAMLAKQYFYHQDKLYGFYRVYNGAFLKEEKHYENGELNGVSRTFYDDGALLEEAHYKEGKRNGVSKWFDQQGRVTIQYEYKDGEMVKN
jgi:antitoxin component YwqK of YwqJK toxin-antitoxin module